MQDTNSYKVRLEEMLETITKELQSVGIHNPQNSNDWVAVPDTEGDSEDPDDNVTADNIEELNERTALVETLEPQYNDIVSALAKIDAGTYGSCEVCSTPIEEKRLDAFPTARTCMTHIEEVVV
jgi:DnaK suppressor protein